MYYTIDKGSREATETFWLLTKIKINFLIGEKKLKMSDTEVDNTIVYETLYKSRREGADLFGSYDLSDPPSCLFTVG